MPTRLLIAAGAVLAFSYIAYIVATPTPERPSDAAISPPAGTVVRKVE